MNTRRPLFKQSQVFTWEAEPADERPSEFASSAFMSAAPRRRTTRSEKSSAAVLLIYVAATLCGSSVLLYGVVSLLKS